MANYTKSIPSFLFMFMALLEAPMAEEFKVGDAAGWTTGVNYKAWASEHKFRKGDTLRFVYNGGRHDVQQVSKKEFQSCKVKWSTNNTSGGGDDRISLPHSGKHYYFICGFANMCQSGMKLEVKVPHHHRRPRRSDAARSSFSLYTLLAPACAFSLNLLI